MEYAWGLWQWRGLIYSPAKHILFRYSFWWRVRGGEEVERENIQLQCCLFKIDPEWQVYIVHGAI